MWRRTSFCRGPVSRKLDSYWCFRLALLQLVSYFFFRYWSPSLSLCAIFDTISFNTDELLSINPSANVFAFKDWLTYSGGTDRPDEPRYNFSMKWPPQIVNFLIRISGCDSQSPFGFISSFWCYYLFCNGFLSIRKFWSCCCVSFLWLSIKVKTGCLFHCIAYDYSWPDWNGLHDHLRDISKLSASAAASEFCEWGQIRKIDIYTLHRKYQVKPHSSPWFSAACAAAVVHRNHFFE